MERSLVFLLPLAVAACSPPPAEQTLAAARASPQAAASTVATYYRLVEAGRMAEAAALREDGLTEDVAPFLSLKAEVAAARAAEGPGPWRYVRVPVALTGRFVTGGVYRASGAATLRVATQASAPPEQRRWRILRIDVRAQP